MARWLERVPGDDEAGELADSIAWALTSVRDNAAAMFVEDLDRVAAAYEEITAELRESARLVRQRAGEAASGASA